MAKLRLGLHYHLPMKQSLDGFYMIGHFGRFVDSLARKCQRLYCFFHAPKQNELAIFDYRLQSDNIEWIDIGPHESIVKRELFINTYLLPFRMHRMDIDALLIRGPSPLLPAITMTVAPTPVVFLLGGDYTQGINDLPQPIWRRELIRLWSYLYKRRQTNLCKSHLTFVNSPLLYDELKSVAPRLIQVRTTTLNSEDFFERLDTCTKPPFHLLYTGRITQFKGISEIIRALCELVIQGEDVFLDLVGPVEKGECIDQYLSCAAQLGVQDRVKYHGYKTIGSDLFDYYRNADIFVMATKSYEGFPRVIWEAMAHSLPVVATRVGGIPDFIEGAAELVSPGSVKELTLALSRLLHSSELRHRLINRGMTLVQENTLDYQANFILNHIDAWVNLHKD